MDKSYCEKVVQLMAGIFLLMAGIFLCFFGRYFVFASFPVYWYSCCDIYYKLVKNSVLSIF